MRKKFKILWKTREIDMTRRCAKILRIKFLKRKHNGKKSYVVQRYGALAVKLKPFKYQLQENGNN